MRNVLGAHLLLLQLLTKHVTCNLMFVYGIWSAGYRAPLGIPYPNDENTRSKWPRGWNRPTEFGLNQMYEMGTWMRRRYVVQEKAISPVYDNGRIVHGLPQPAWLNRTYEGGTLLDWIRNSYNTLTTHDYNTKLKTRLRVGVLVNDIVESLINRVYYGRQPSQALFNSVNGPTILGLKHALGIADGTVPEPGTLLLVEVHRTLFDEYIVQIYSRNTSGILISHRLPTCARNCLLDDFITILRPMRLKPEDLDVMCERTDEAFSRHANLFGIVLILPILLTLQ
ncbi:hypothetical protein Q1695_007143 [Nippostrongylus brasiliensis]|nr:hypothetical protein Q1695_007143 [Nippostrongylus brasiliensis]